MLSSLQPVKVYLATGSTDMRKSINGLLILISEQMELDLFSGHLFAFCNRKRDMIKILYWDCNGFCLWHKRLEKDRFKWPKSASEVLHLTTRELHWLLDGLSLNQADAYQQLSYSVMV